MVSDMKNSIRLSSAYIRYYKKQAATLLLGVILSAALLTGIGSLFESGQYATLENARTKYGDWHFSTRGDFPWAEEFKNNPQGKGYKIEKYGMETVRKAIAEQYNIQLVYADQGYLDMMGRKLIEGKYPEKENEIAMDSYTMKNLNIQEKLGSQVVLDGKTFNLCGILTEMPEKLSQMQGDFMQIFVNSTLDYGMNGTFLYLKFAENGNVYRQLSAFAKEFGANIGDFSRNKGVASYVGAEPLASIFETIKVGLTYKELGIPYIWGQLNANGLLMEKVILAALGFFGAFIIYSLFQISVSKRMAQYSVMQTLGMSDSNTFLILMLEMCMIFTVGYPMGSILGNVVATVIYRKSGQIFIIQNQTYHTGGGSTDLENAAINLPDSGEFHISWNTAVYGAIFLFIVLFLISWMMLSRMKKMTARQMIAKDTGKHGKNRKIYSTKHGNLTGVLTKKFMLSRKSTFFGILLSLSIGSIIFLGATYVTENTKTNNELTFKADDGLASDIQIYKASDQLTDMIPENVVKEMENVTGLKSIHPVRYLLGEVPLKDGRLLWTKYFNELKNDENNPPDQEIMDKYNGLAVKTGDEDYTLKINIYGYDDEMLEELNNYLLEGTIDPEQMRKDNSMIFKTLMDGQGNYDGIQMKPGDTIQLKTVKDVSVPAEALRFLGKNNWYQEKELKVAALTSRPLAKVDTFIGDDANSDRVDIIMTNEQMEENFGIIDYQTVSISLEEEADADRISVQLKEMTLGVDKCIVKDYSKQIKAQNLYLMQKMLFFYGIAAVLLGISILHIMNSMQYLVISRKHEFGIMRAMGITYVGFCKMLAKEGLRYGIYSSLVITVIYFMIQKVLNYFMIHVYLYLHPKVMISWIPFVSVLMLNIAICVLVVLFAGRSVLKEEIIDEIKG